MTRSRLTYSLGSLAVLLGLAAGGCAPYLHPFTTERAHPGLQSAKFAELTSLPQPQEKIVVAVYRFRDQTGQYKASDRMASWSTAVTQGATSILMRALEESAWFIPIEREGLSNLLNERQIIQSIRAQHSGPDGEALGPLPPLLYAGLLLEGGIIGYDTNLLTSGVGVRYFGAGGSGQIRQDQVTIYLRAISTQNGRVLKTVHTTKTIISQKVDGSLFRYVDVKRILESEVGYTVNEPPVLAVTEAIEEAVKNLVVEGIRENLWAMNPTDSLRAAEVFASYDEARAEADEMDYFGRIERTNRPGPGIGLFGSALLLRGDYHDAEARPGGELTLRKTLIPSVSAGLTGSFGQLAARDAFERNHLSAEADLTWYLLPSVRLTPIAKVGLGYLVQSYSAAYRGGRSEFPYATAALGLEYMISSRVGVSALVGNDYPLYEGLDGVRMGSIHDNVWSLKTGLTFYPF